MTQRPLAASLCARRKAGFVLPELVLVLVIVGVLSALALPPLWHARDQWAADGAASLVVRAAADARHLARQRTQRLALHIDTTGAVLHLAAGPDTFATHALHEIFGVTLQTTRDSIAWSASGLGYGAANTRIIVQRGSAAETVIVSRLGRLRR